MPRPVVRLRATARDMRRVVYGGVGGTRDLRRHITEIEAVANDLDRGVRPHVARGGITFLPLW